MKYNLNKLNNMNYYFSCPTETYYLTNGIRSLYYISNRYNVSFKDLCKQLLIDGQVVYKEFNVTMI